VNSTLQPAARVTLVIGGGPSGGVLELLDGRSAPLYGDLPWDELLRAGAWLRSAIDTVDTVELPEHSAEVDRTERAGAERLFDALTAGRSRRVLRERLIGLRGAAESAGRPFELIVDARLPEARDLPWELLAALPPGHPMAGVEVLRLVPCPSPRPVPAPALRLEILLWEPVPTDPISARLSAHLVSLVYPLPRVSIVRLDPRLLELPPPAGEDVARVLHVIGHGREASAGVLLEQLQGATSAGAVVRSLGELLLDVRLVLLAVCSAAAESAGPLDTPASLFAAAGVPVSIGPRLELSEEAAAAFAEGFYPALDRGHPVSYALAEGRRLMAVRDDPHPTARWWNSACHLSDLQAAATACLTRPTLPDWPPGRPECEEILARAIERATAWGFVGVEHLWLAIASTASLGRIATAFRAEEHRIRAGLDHLHPRTAVPAIPDPTPRLRLIGQGLGPGYLPLELAERLLMARSVLTALGSQRARHLRALIQLGADTVDPGPTSTSRDTDDELALPEQPQAGAPVLEGPDTELTDPGENQEGRLILEALGGPDDGRRFVLEPGTVLGRWDRKRPEITEGRLYVPPLPENTRVSRRHLLFVGGAPGQAGGGGRVRAPDEAGPGRALNPGQQTDLHIGDVVLLDVLLQEGGVQLLVRSAH